MVMHARKQPRVNDGYTERKDAHLQQWLDHHQQRGNGGKYSNRSPAEGSHSRHSRTDSPGSQPSPRYHNKVAYLERHKDKRGSLHLAEEKVSQYLATGSIGERAPPNYGDYDEHEHDRHSDGSHGHGHDREASRRGETKEEREHRVEVQKSAVRVCGDWSEHISSSGKRYYYNCQTEVSQWEKPKEWVQSAKRPERTRDSRGNGKSSSSTSDRRHSNTSEPSEGRNPAYHAGDSSSYSGAHQRTSEQRQSTDVPGSSSRGSGTPHYQESGGGGGVRRNSVAAETYPSSHNHKGQSGGYSGYPDLKRNNVHAESYDDEPARQRPKVDSDSGQRSSQRREAIQTLQEFQKALSLHINRQQSGKGPSQSATSSSAGATSSHLSGPEQSMFLQADSYSHSLYHNEQPQYSPHNNTYHIPQQASCSSALPGEEGLGDSNHHHHQQYQQYQQLGKNNSIEQDGGESPVSELSAGTSCHSPTPSMESPPAMPAIGTSALSAAALKSQQAVGLSPALSNYYNEKLIGHVLGWQGEQIEKQAERFRHEALLVGSLSCSQVCVNLKRARSSVRTAEIQSTIHEQRLLMLQQQRQEIENLKPPTSLLPSSSS